MEGVNQQFHQVSSVSKMTFNLDWRYMKPIDDGMRTSNVKTRVMEAIGTTGQARTKDL